MKKIFNLLAVAIMMAVMPFVAKAQTNAEPIITFKTNIYDTYGTSNAFSLVLGSLDTCYVDVDCGFGLSEYEIVPAAFDDGSGSITGTYIECSVSKDGLVKIYGDASQIDYLNASGCYIDWIEFAEGVKLDILELSHNELKKLDLTEQTELRALYLSDNTFTAETPLVIGANKPNLYILEVSIIDYMDPSFNLSDYPNMMSFDGYHNVSLTQIDPTGCPYLQRLTLDVTNVSSVDVSKNPNLLILNVSETKVTSIDVSKNSYLRELYCTHTGAYNCEYKIEKLDVTNNPNLMYLFCSGNKIKELDLTKNSKLQYLDARDNYLTSIDLTSCQNSLYQVYLNKNCMDYATLPVNPGTWNTYYYGQRPMEVEKSCPEGAEFDFSKRVLREGSTTTVAVYAVSEYNDSVSEVLDESYYNYVDGKLKILKAHSDSLRVEFVNTLFNENNLTTTKFLVKTASEYGKPTKVFNFTTSISDGGDIAFGVGAEGASVENPVEFYVDFGDQNQVKFVATSSNVPVAANVVGKKAGYGAVAVYAPEGVTITALNAQNIPMYSVDVTKLASLRELNIVNAGLYTIDLSWNRCLQSLNLSGNNLSVLNLSGPNNSYSKNVLANINLSHNNLTEIELNDMRAIRNLDLSYNKLSEAISFYNGDYVESINLSHNEYFELDFTYCYALKNLDISYNKLPSVVMPEASVLEYFACNDNLFTMATLPSHGTLKDENYIYAPQADFQIATKGPGVDLSELNREGNTTYLWKKISGETLVEGVDYTIKKGVTSFVNTTMGKVYCEMTNTTFPGFVGEKVYKTTQIEAAGMPTNLIASFKTVNEGDSVRLSLAAAKAGTALYIDWEGDNTVTQYLLGDTYKLFDAYTKAGANVKVYTYEPTEAITVFSMGGAKLESFDGSKLTDAINISVTGAGLSEIKLPEGSAKLQELSLESNAFTSFDFSKYPALRTVAMTGNKLTSLDLTKNADLELFSAANNLITEVKLDNKNLWALYLDNNSLANIDLSGAPNISQLSLSSNKLSSINVDVLPNLIMLVLSNNEFTFKTLPLNKEKYVIYYYHGQAPLEVACVDGKVDLSDQIKVGETLTTYQWFLGVPAVNQDTGELEGEELVLGTEYTIENGVTTFLTSLDGVMCVMTNAELPNVFIFTDLMNVTSSGVEQVMGEVSMIVIVNGNDVVVKTQEAGKAVKLYGMNGAELHSAVSVEGETVFSDVVAGAYIVKVDNEAVKVLVK